MFSAKILLYWIVSMCAIVCAIDARIIKTDDEMIEQRKFAQMDSATECQMACLNEFLFDSAEIVNPFGNIIDQCIERSKCYMCYDFCEILSEESRMIGKLMCTNDTCVRLFFELILSA